MKDDSLLYTLASNNCLCDRKVFQNGVSTFSKIVFNQFLQKKKCSIFTSMWSKYLSKMYGDNRLPMSASVKCLIGKSIFAVNLPLKLFRVTVKNADTGILKSLQTLFDTHWDHMLTKFEPNLLS